MSIPVMNDILPIEISNIIYILRCNIILKDICNKYSIDYNKFCNFLTSNTAVLSGSACLHCLDNQCKFNDLDIFIHYTNTDNDTMKYYKDFLNVFTIDSSIVNIEKNPLSNSLLEVPNNNKPDYFYKFKYLNKIIDMTILLESPKEVLNKYKLFSCSNIWFDGKNWKFPYRNIEYFLQYKQIKIINPFDTYFEDIYDPWQVDTLGEIDKCLEKYILTNETIKYINPKMKYIYEKYSYYYEQYYTIADRIKHRADKMIKLYDKLYDNNYDWSIRSVYKLGWDGDYYTINYNINDEFDKEISYEPIYKHLEYNNYQKQYLELYKVYKGIYKILKYILKGYVITNIQDFLV